MRQTLVENARLKQSQKHGGSHRYDRALRKVGLEDEGVRFVVKQQQEE